MKKIASLLLLLLPLALSAKKLPESELMVRSQMSRCPNASYLDYREGKFKWNYTPGLELKAFLDVYERYGGKDIFEYVDAWYDTLISEDGSIAGYKLSNYSTDHICPAKTLFYLYDKTGKEKYRKAMNLIMKQIEQQPRTSDGAFWHKKIYPHQIWLDGVYMAEPFYAEYVSRWFPEDKKAAAWDEIVNEFIVAAKHCFDPETGLYRHGYDESRSAAWSDPKTGQSAHCWGRALGWYCMALVEVLDYLPADHSKRDELIGILSGICEILPSFNDKNGFAWYQVLDQPGREGNYIESTCTAMFCYSYLKAIRMGYISRDFLPYAKKVYDYMVSSFIRRDKQGLISITRCCEVGGLGGKQNRMGDYKYYLSEPVRDNDSKGVGPFIWASLEMERLGDYEFESLYKDLPFEMERIGRPSIPSRTVSLADFGGNPDGQTLNTEAFARAMSELSKKGGGHLLVPDGKWLTGPIVFKSNIDLHLSKGATVVFSDDPSLYQVIDTNFEGLDTRRCISPLYAKGCRNISISGEGTFEGNGDSWRLLKKNKVSDVEWTAHLAKYPEGVVSKNGKIWYPDKYFMDAATRKTTDQNVCKDKLDEDKYRRFLRPVLLLFDSCENILIEGVTFRNSPCWNLHPLFSKNIIIKNITVTAPYYSQNGDGLDIDACRNVIVSGCRFDVGDDAICIKSGKNEDGRRHATPCENLIINGCTVLHGHGGFVVGSEMSGGVRNIKVSNCIFSGTDVGLRFKSARGRGGVVEGIWADHITMKDIPGDAIIFNLYYEGKSALQAKGTAAAKESKPVDVTTPEFRDIHISNISCTGAARAMFFNGLPEMPVKGIEIRDCKITAGKGIVLSDCKDISIKNLSLNISEGNPVETSSVENLQMSGTTVNGNLFFTVASDGSGDFRTIQEAINACPDYDHGHITTIHIKAGVYKEMVTIPHNKFRLKIYGDGAEKTIITFDKYARQTWPGTNNAIGTSGSATMYIHSSYVTLEDLTIENSAGEGKAIAQAVALFTDGDFIFLNRCRLLGNQDTLYTYGRYGKDGGIKRNYYLDCYIEGTTDFIFGPSICYFENCHIHSKKNSYVTAASTLKGQKYGYVFKGCKLTAAEGINKCYLGRPWGAYAKTVFIECELGAHILPEGWHDWEKEGKPNTKENCYYAEYRNSGPGAAGESGRVSWSHQLTDSEASEYEFSKVLYQENDGIRWNPFENK